MGTSTPYLTKDDQASLTPANPNTAGVNTDGQQSAGVLTYSSSPPSPLRSSLGATPELGLPAASAIGQFGISHGAEPQAPTTDEHELTEVEIAALRRQLRTLLNKLFCYFSRTEEDIPPHLHVIEILNCALDEGEYEHIDYKKSSEETFLFSSNACAIKVIQHELHGILYPDFHVLTALSIINNNLSNKQRKPEDLPAILTAIKKEAAMTLKTYFRVHCSDEISSLLKLENFTDGQPPKFHA